MDPRLKRLENQTRRPFLQQSTAGIGSMALASLLAGDGVATAAVVDPSGNPLAVRRPHFAPRAKRVIYLHMTGSPPNLDLFDYKPELVQRNNQDCPDEFLAGREFAFTSGTPKLMG